MAINPSVVVFLVAASAAPSPGAFALNRQTTIGGKLHFRPVASGFHFCFSHSHYRIVSFYVEEVNGKRGFRFKEIHTSVFPDALHRVGRDQTRQQNHRHPRPPFRQTLNRPAPCFYLTAGNDTFLGPLRRTPARPLRDPCAFHCAKETCQVPLGGAFELVECSSPRPSPPQVCGGEGVEGGDSRLDSPYRGGGVWTGAGGVGRARVRERQR